MNQRRTKWFMSLPGMWEWQEAVVTVRAKAPQPTGTWGLVRLWPGSDREWEWGPNRALMSIR